MIIRSRAPLRIGLAGGGTDVSPYSDQYGGAILNATISLFAYATIEPLDTGKIIIHAIDKKEIIEFDATEELPVDGELVLAKGIYNRIVKDYTHKPLTRFRNRHERPLWMHLPVPDWVPHPRW